MKTKLNTARTRSKLLSLLAVAAMAFGCSTHDTDFDEPFTGENPSEMATLSVEIPGMVVPSTRSMNGLPENEVAEVDVLIFSVSGTTETLVSHSHTNVVTNSVSNSVYKAEFKVKVPTVTNGRIVVVANASTQVAAALLAKPVGSLKQDFLAELQFDHFFSGGATHEPWPADVAGNDYLPLPMYGETAATAIGPSKAYTLALRRMHARVDLVNSASNFTLKAMWIANESERGYIAPLWNATGQIITPFSKTPNMQSGWKSATSNQYFSTPDISAQAISGRAYVLESAAASDATASGRIGATHMIVYGEYDGVDYYYRIDFTEFVDPTDPLFDPEDIKYMGILRNHKYSVDITRVDGPGHLQMSGATNDYTSMSNLKTNIMSYDESKIKNIEFNGQHMLGVGDETVHVYKQEQILELDVFTNYELGWSAKIRGHTDNGAWLTFDSNVSTGAKGSTKVKLHLDLNTTGYRVAYVDITAGKLTKSIAVAQWVHSDHLIYVTMENGTSPSSYNPFKFDYNVSGIVPMKRLFVDWVPKDKNCVVTETQSATPFEYDAASERILPGNISGGIQTYHITPTPGVQSDVDNFLVKETKYTFSLYDDYGNLLTSQTVSVFQGEYTVIPEGFKMGGFREQTINAVVKSNADWAVSKSDPYGIIESFTPASGSANMTGTPFAYTFKENTSATTRSASFRFSSPTGQFAPVTVHVTQGPMAPLFARSNIVYRNGKLCFATTEAENATITANSIGMFFRFGSLVGLSADLPTLTCNLTESDIVFRPAGVSMPSSFSAIPYYDDWSNLGEYYAWDDRDDFMLTYPGKGYDENTGKGDICRYISDQGWVSGGPWRTPTAYEIFTLAELTPVKSSSGSNGLVYGGLSGTPITGNAPGWYGNYQLSNGVLLGTGVTPSDPISNLTVPASNRVLFPLSGSINYTGTYSRLSGYYPTSTNSDVAGYKYGISAHYSSRIFGVPQVDARAATPVRCIKDRDAVVERSN